MFPLHIALHDGFRDHSVTISVSGREVYRKQHVSTDLSISRADAVDSSAPGKARVEVSVEPGHYTASLEVDPALTAFVAVSLEGEQLTLKASKELFRYL